MSFAALRKTQIIEIVDQAVPDAQVASLKHEQLRRREDCDGGHQEDSGCDFG
jgi:hypothetical protein